MIAINLPIYLFEDITDIFNDINLVKILIFYYSFSIDYLEKNSYTFSINFENELVPIEIEKMEKNMIYFQKIGIDKYNILFAYNILLLERTSEYKLLLLQDKTVGEYINNNHRSFIECRCLKLYINHTSKIYFTVFGGTFSSHSTINYGYKLYTIGNKILNNILLKAMYTTQLVYS